MIERAAIAQRGFTIEADHPALNTSETDRELIPDELEHRISPEAYFISFVDKYPPQYIKPEIVRMPSISRKSLWEKRQRLDIPARKL